MTELLYCAEHTAAGGFGTARAVLVRWLAPEGSPVHSGQPLAEVRTGQHHTHVNALATGTLRQQVRAGESVISGFPVGLIE
ncbi:MULTISPECIES: biotin/lipoyl-containing protein [Actinopolyspora]|uniref:Biotin-requiring enzyme n=1 Tax=Actinopolyspora saharensis TaxID=995062 RepID=A0A1H1DR91_9ACTN|nr:MULTISPECIES: biotin/lipoyl-containing protein [Actinopolyspora]NHD18383.1 hypothetical protein [Actinopolyspora sp. BKK2]NHE77658.1 hypothetical protein [Actinopolyspora sp. BKK1]SDQ79015.1 Biotin-requiring enzyme [Actinopolyspora saharensis]